MTLRSLLAIPCQPSASARRRDRQATMRQRSPSIRRRPAFFEPRPATRPYRGHIRPSCAGALPATIQLVAEHQRNGSRSCHCRRCRHARAVLHLSLPWTCGDHIAATARYRQPRAMRCCVTPAGSRPGKPPDRQPPTAHTGSSLNRYRRRRCLALGPPGLPLLFRTQRRGEQGTTTARPNCLAAVAMSATGACMPNDRRCIPSPEQQSLGSERWQVVDCRAAAFASTVAAYSCLPAAGAWPAAAIPVTYGEAAHGSSVRRGHIAMQSGIVDLVQQRQHHREQTRASRAASSAAASACVNNSVSPARRMHRHPTPVTHAAGCEVVAGWGGQAHSARSGELPRPGTDRDQPVQPPSGVSNGPVGAVRRATGWLRGRSTAAWAGHGRSHVLPVA